MKLPTALCVYGDRLYYADQVDTSIHVADKTTGDQDVVLRNNIDNVLALKIYDPEVHLAFGCPLDAFAMESFPQCCRFHSR